MSGCCAPTFGTAGPRLPERRALTAPAPRAALPTQSRSTVHARRSDPEATAKWRQRRGATIRRNLACMPESPILAEPRYNPELPERGRSGGLTPPPQAPRSRAETSATSAERRRTRPVYRYCDPFAARVRPCVPCVPCVSRLPPVSFYRYCTGSMIDDTVQYLYRAG